MAEKKDKEVNLSTRVLVKLKEDIHNYAKGTTVFVGSLIAEKWISKGLAEKVEGDGTEKIIKSNFNKVVLSGAESDKQVADALKLASDAQAQVNELKAKVEELTANAAPVAPADAKKV